MLKKYKSKSCVSLSVVLPTGGTTHISFNPITGGGSVYYTNNEKIQAGLEKHPKYGKLFKLENEVTPSVEAVKPSGKAEGTTAEKPDGDAAGTTAADKTAGTALKEIKMSCNDDAKDYLVEKFGISRTKLRSRAQIEAAGISNGIKFVWA